MPICENGLCLDSLVYRRILVRELWTAKGKSRLVLVERASDKSLKVSFFGGEVHSTAFVDSVVAVLQPGVGISVLLEKVRNMRANDLLGFLDTEGMLATEECRNANLLCLTGDDAGKQILLC